MNRCAALSLVVMALGAEAAFGAVHSTGEGIATTVESPVAVTALANGHALVDFGRNAAGYLQFEAKAACDYHVIVGELLNADGSINTRDGGQMWNCHYTMVTGSGGKSYKTSVRFVDIATNVAAAGVCRVPFAFKWQKRFDTAASVKADRAAIGDVTTFRYVEVVKAPALVAPADFRRVTVHADFDYGESSFVSSDVTLNKVYELCKWSVYADSYLGYWVDGDRERKLYEADQYPIQNVCAALFTDNRVTRRSTLALVSDASARNGIFEWPQFIPLLAYADWFNSGDPSLINAPSNWARILDKSVIRTDREQADGIITALSTDCASIVDHPPENLYDYDMGKMNAARRAVSNRRRMPFENALHYASLRAVANMANARGDHSLASAYAARADTTYRGFQNVFFDASAGLYRDRVNEGGYVSRHHSLQANAYALAFDLVPAEHRERVANFVATNRVADGMSASPFAAYFVLEGLCKAGRADAAIDYMTSTNRNSWVNMMREGLTTAGETWSLFSSVVGGNFYDMSHAWGTAPAYVVSRYILGVRPVTAGFEQAVVAPQFGSLAWAKGTVPTPKGAVEVVYTNSTLTVKLPPAMGSALVTFGGTARKAAGGSTVVIGNTGR